MAENLPQQSGTEGKNTVEVLKSSLKSAKDCSIEARKSTASEPAMSICPQMLFQDKYESGAYSHTETVEGSVLPDQISLIKLRISKEKGTKDEDRYGMMVKDGQSSALEGSVDRVPYPGLYKMFKSKEGLKKYNDEWKKDFHNAAVNFKIMQDRIDFTDFQKMDKDQVDKSIMAIILIEDPTNSDQWYEALKSLGRKNTTGPEGVLQLLLAMTRATKKVEDSVSFTSISEKLGLETASELIAGSDLDTLGSSTQ